MRSIPTKKRETGFFKEVWMAHNEVLDVIREIAPQQSGGRGVRVQRTSNGTLFSIEPGLRPSSTTLKRFRFVRTENDYYVCNEFTGDGEDVSEEETNVAKLEELRHTGWHGETIIYSFPSFPESPGQLQVTYTYIGGDYRTALFQHATGTVTEHQIISPVLIVNRSVILAARIENGTGVEDADEWIEVGPRAWMSVAEEVDAGA